MSFWLLFRYKNTNKESLKLNFGSLKANKVKLLFSELLEDDGKHPPKRLQMSLDLDVIYLPFSSTSSGAKGIMHTHKSLLASFYSPEGAANHWFDQLIGER
jgi:hypothetical protein